MDTTIEILTGTTAFLNGQAGLHDIEEKLSKSLINHGKEVLILDNLFDEPKNLIHVAKCDNMVLSTRGMYADKLQPLIKAFEKMKYAPKVVIFMDENSALYFVGIARKLKTAGTKFYFPDILDGKGLMEIIWI